MVPEKQERMNSRERILKEISANKPQAFPMTSVELQGSAMYEDHAANFMATLEKIGGRGRIVTKEQMKEVLQRLKGSPQTYFFLDGLDKYGLYIDKSAEALQDLQTVALIGSIAVAENAAIWLPESSMPNRLLPFICEELILVIEKNNIVPDMHAAYQKIRTDETGYGVFIAGPSKTADIEQSLVIGAHGPLSLQVFIIE